MKMGLKLKLTLSYAMVAAFLASSILLVSSHFLEEQFQVYVMHKQDMKNDEIIDIVSKNFFDGESSYPNFVTFLTNLGESLMGQGVALMVYDADGNMLFCTDTGEGRSCAHVQGYGGAAAAPHGEECMDFGSSYTQKSFDITRDGVKAGSVLLGYHGPFLYSEGDREFLNRFNRVSLGMAVFFFAVSIAIGLMMAGRIAGPIRRVTTRTRRIAEGEYSERVNLETGTSEIDDLASSVDHLARSLETQLALKKRMANAYSHEFRTPLAALQSNLEAMADGLWAPTAERLEGLLAETHRLSRMVSEIDNLVQARDWTAPSSRTNADLSEMTEHVIRSFETSIKSKEINVRYEHEPCEAFVDRDKFGQVIFNLVSNAVKYTNRGGNILIRAFNMGDRAVFSIRDDGIGISEDDIPHIFDYLYRADESRTRGSGGNGIGLSVVKAVVDAHGGVVEVKSRLGHGSAFRVEVARAGP
ncbi:MAG: HAMP domain-containing histidine kinase [Synergistaceae bacterium]|jgi:signal transduction histidine kinase|nr:HAMP domain-containing histidine kinase [Synergistaceae bacterium]